MGALVKQISKTSVHVVFISETAGSEKPGDLSDLSVLPVDRADTVKASRTLQISYLGNIEAHVKKRIKMSEKLKTHSKLCDLIPIYSLFTPGKFHLIRNLTHILRRPLKALAIQSSEDCKQISSVSNVSLQYI